MNIFFTSVIDTSISAAAFLLCTGTSLILGILIALAHCFRNRATPGFLIALALIPMISQTIVHMVNGSIGAGIAVAGAFSLIRFRSIPGTAREICSIFLAMTVGICTGMGYVGIAALVCCIVLLASMLYTVLLSGKFGSTEKTLKITIPETLDYEEVFDDLFREYTIKYQLIRVKTVHMGSLFQLEYKILLRDSAREKSFIDALRCRNGNLEIVCSRTEFSREEM
ncbi:MAG: DUF4956 domain-containing protein [Clostridiales bacterium]|jgi:hypothetical protein|nr:DUF4956 domain-containing protein [Clostridiales bacterium]